MPTLNRWSSMRQNLRGRVFKSSLKATITTRLCPSCKRKMDPKAYTKRQNWASRTRPPTVRSSEGRTRQLTCHNRALSQTTAKLSPTQQVSREEVKIARWARAITRLQITTRTSLISPRFRTMQGRSSSIRRATAQPPPQTRPHTIAPAPMQCLTASTLHRIWAQAARRLRISTAPTIEARPKTSRTRLPPSTPSISIKTATRSNSSSSKSSTRTLSHNRSSRSSCRIGR